MIRDFWPTVLQTTLTISLAALLLTAAGCSSVPGKDALLSGAGSIGPAGSGSSNGPGGTILVRGPFRMALPRDSRFVLPAPPAGGSQDVPAGEDAAVLWGWFTQGEPDRREPDGDGPTPVLRGSCVFLPYPAGPGRPADLELLGTRLTLGLAPEWKVVRRLETVMADGDLGQLVLARGADRAHRGEGMVRIIRPAESGFAVGELTGPMKLISRKMTEISQSLHSLGVSPLPGDNRIPGKQGGLMFLGGTGPWQWRGEAKPNEEAAEQAAQAGDTPGGEDTVLILSAQPVKTTDGGQPDGIQPEVLGWFAASRGSLARVPAVPVFHRKEEPLPFTALVNHQERKLTAEAGWTETGSGVLRFTLDAPEGEAVFLISGTDSRKDLQEFLASERVQLLLAEQLYFLPPEVDQ